MTVGCKEWEENGVGGLRIKKRPEKDDKTNTSEKENNESEDTGISVLIERVALELVEAVEKELKRTKKGDVSRNEIMKHAAFWARLVVMHQGHREELPEECTNCGQRLTDLRQQVWKRVNFYSTRGEV